MKSDKIVEIGIDDQGRLYLIPENESFTLIWRSATQVHWDSYKASLYSPRPQEWSYYDWYCHIISVVKDEYGCKLIIATDTKWINIPEQLRNEIIQS